LIAATGRRSVVGDCREYPLHGSPPENDLISALRADAFKGGRVESDGPVVVVTRVGKADTRNKFWSAESPTERTLQYPADGPAETRGDRGQTIAGRARTREVESAGHRTYNQERIAASAAGKDLEVLGHSHRTGTYVISRHNRDTDGYPVAKDDDGWRTLGVGIVVGAHLYLGVVRQVVDHRVDHHVFHDRRNCYLQGFADGVVQLSRQEPIDRDVIGRVGIIRYPMAADLGVPCGELPRPGGDGPSSSGDENWHRSVSAGQHAIGKNDEGHSRGDESEL
jgi:hypothetical protein